MLVATTIVVAAAVVEAAVRDAIGVWTGVTLIAVSVLASLVTRAGDRSLPAMMPPLAFLAGALVGGQLLTDASITGFLAQQGAMLVEVLGSNSAWVVAATACSVTICSVRHLIDRRRGRRTTPSEQPAERHRV